MDAVILEMEEKSHDEVEESVQLALKPPRWQENEASDFLTKPAKTRRGKAAAGDDLKLIKGAKGMHFPSGQDGCRHVLQGRKQSKTIQSQLWVDLR